MKKFLSVMCVFVFVFASVLSSASASPLEYRKISVDQYKEYLREKSRNDNLAKESLDKFNELSLREQQRFIELMNNPQAQLEALEALATLENGQTKSLYNGDIIVSKSVEKFNDNKAKAAAPQLQQSNGVYQETLTLLGLPVTIFKIQVWFKYDPSNHVVHETLRSEESHWNINLGTLVDDLGSEHWVSGTLACAMGKFKVSLTIVGGAISTTHKLYIQCDDIDVGGWMETF